MSLPSFFLLGFIGIGGLGALELVIVGIVAVVLFGGKLPEVARTVGQSYQQFRKGLADLQSSFTTDVDINLKDPIGIHDYSDVDDYDEPDAPTFEPPPAEQSTR